MHGTFDRTTWLLQRRLLSDILIGGVRDLLRAEKLVKVKMIAAGPMQGVVTWKSDRNLRKVRRAGKIISK